MNSSAHKSLLEEGLNKILCSRGRLLMKKTPCHLTARKIHDIKVNDNLFVSKNSLEVSTDFVS